MRLQIGFLLFNSLRLYAANQEPGGDIVPFTSILPPCDLECEPLLDVQYSCTPPDLTSVSATCFCSEARLQPILQNGIAGMSSICIPLNCTATTYLEKIQSQFATLCSLKSITVVPTTSRWTLSGVGGPSTSNLTSIESRVVEDTGTSLRLQLQGQQKASLLLQGLDYRLPQILYLLF